MIRTRYNTADNTSPAPGDLTPASGSRHVGPAPPPAGGRPGLGLGPAPAAVQPPVVVAVPGPGLQVEPGGLLARTHGLGQESLRGEVR